MEKSAMFADNPYMRHMGPGFQPLYDRFAAPRALSMGEQAGNAFWHGPLRQVEEMGRAMVTGHNNNPTSRSPSATRWIRGLAAA